MPIDRFVPRSDMQEFRIPKFRQTKTGVLVEQKVQMLSPDHKEIRLIKETYALKDKSGDVACLVEAAFASDINQEHNARILTSLELWKGGKKIDVIQLMDLKEDVTVCVLTDPMPGAQFSYRPSYEKRDGKMHHTIIVPPPDSFMGIAIALHEFGHAKQDENPFFFDIRDLNFEIEGDVVDKAREVLARFPELKDQMPSDDAARMLDSLQDVIALKYLEIFDVKQEMDRMRHDRDLLQKKSALLANKIPHAGFFEKRKVQAELKETLLCLEQLKIKFVAAQEKVTGLYQMVTKENKKLHNTEQLYKDIVHMPRRLMERDATRRAFMWMNQIEKTIGLSFKTLPVPEPRYHSGRLVLDPDCSKSTTRAMAILQKLPEAEQRANGKSRKAEDISTRDYLLSCLGSYDAFEKIPFPILKHLGELERAEEKKRKTKSPGP